MSSSKALMRRACAAIGFALASLIVSPANAELLVKVGQLEVFEPFVRAMPGNAKVGAGYVKIRNVGDQPDRLVAVESSAAKSVEVHNMSHEGGVMKMWRLSDGLVLPPKSTTELGPGGLHLMFMEPLAPFKLGETVRATLAFENAGKLEVSFQVKPIGSR